jgi:hypothetical protein
MTPFSPIDEIEEWIRRIKEMLAERPHDEGLLFALEELERIRAQAMQIVSNESTTPD